MVESTQTSAVRMYCRFCNDVSVDPKSVTDSVIKMIILFQKNVSVDLAYKLMFPDGSFLNWDKASLLGRDRCYADSPSWVGLMTYVDVSLSEAETRVLFKEYPVFHHFDDSLKQAGLKVDVWCFVSLYLLVNVGRLQAMNVVEQFFSIIYNRSIRQEAFMFFSLLANRQFDHETQTRALTALLQRHCKIRTQLLVQELDLMELRSQEMDGLFRQKAMRALTGRPKLRGKLKSSQTDSEALFDMDHFANWCANIRFPNVFSLRQRKRLYFVMSQCNTDPSIAITHVLPDKELSDRVMKYPVKQPDAENIFDSVSECRISQDPFPELHKFRARCFTSFALEQKATLRLNDLLHLYISAYQHPSIWKNVWKMSIPILSIQIIRDVESFVEHNPFNGTQIFTLMFGVPMAPPRALEPPIKKVEAERPRHGEQDDLVDMFTPASQEPLGLLSMQPQNELYGELERILT